MKRFNRIAVVFCCVFLLFTASASAYTCHQTTVGPLKMYFGTPNRLSQQEIIKELDVPLPLKVKFENSSEAGLPIKLTFKTIETMELLDTDPTSKDMLTQRLEIPAKGTSEVEIKVAARKGTYTAHYPVRLDVEFDVDGKPTTANIIQVVETELPSSGTPKNPMLGQTVDDPKLLPLNTLPERGGLFLPKLDTYRAVWNHDGKPQQVLPVGFQGSDKTSSASISRTSMDRNGIGRQSLGMHPPYKGGVGNVAVEYRVKLPETKPLTLSFFTAVRSVTPPESPSDGLTYRVKADGKTVYEKNSAETDWGAHEVDLSAFAGKEILLTLESDPGPKRNTNCDQCYWGDVILVAGETPTVLSAEAKQKLFEENLQAVKTGKSESPKTKIFQLDGGLVGAVSFGENGFVDGVIGLGNAEKQVQFDGLRVWVKGQAIGSSPTSLAYGPWVPKGEQLKNAPPRPPKKVGDATQRNPRTDNSTSFSQELEINGCRGTLFFDLTKNGPALQFTVDASEIDLIDRIEFGPATRHASRVYYGHGYCIVEPEAFTASAGGHNMSTSHVGMDFENGLSVLQASSFPPDRFIVDPKSKRYTLAVHPSTTMTLLPGTAGALDCAVRFRPLHETKPSAGFKTKAGRFVFEIWGAKYKDHTETVELAVKYGLTDALLIVHNWQRYGYDNRLPDIWPPNAVHGTLAEMQETLKLCDKHGIQYGLHDNYIDFYPDADEFGFDVTTFFENGRPKPAWNNYGIEALSYQFRPDHVQRFLERNLDLMIPELPQSTYFVDVFTSIPPVDYFDREGNFHSRIESQYCWAKAFDTIRDRLSKANPNFPSATTISEAGMDSLIGHLDGADCQFMYISPEQGEFRIPVKCKEWSRVPWFDAVHHTKFSQHGVGYSNRYEAQRGRAVHGIESDDYITSEILTGHALMVDLGSWRRGAIRKYWLAQDLIRNLADKNIEKVEFAEGNVQRQMIRWNDGTFIYVNLGETDWSIQHTEVTLPQYGFWAICPISKNNFSITAIARINGRICEQSSSFDKDGKSIAYVNARQKGAEGVLPITPSLNAFKYLGDNRFTATFKWNAKEPATKDFNVFVHAVEKRNNRRMKINEAVLGGGYPTTPSSQWKGEIVTDNHCPKNADGQPVLTIPDDLPAGRYHFAVGLYDPKSNGQRARLLGYNAGNDRFTVGWLVIERKGSSLGEGKLNKVSNIAVEKFEWDEIDLYERLLPPKEPVDFGYCKTKGAFKIEADLKSKTATVTPLPDEPATEIALGRDDEEIGSVKSVKAIDADGKELRDVPFTFKKGEKHPLVFTTKPGEFAYKIVW